MTAIYTLYGRPFYLLKLNNPLIIQVDKYEWQMKWVGSSYLISLMGQTSKKTKELKRTRQMSQTSRPKCIFNA